MHILYIHQYFITPHQQGSTRSYELSRYLLKHGHQVTMVTSGVQNTAFPVKGREFATTYEVDGIRLISVRGGYNDARSGTAMPGWRRFLSFHGFAWAAVRAGKRVEEPDLVFATHTPLTVGYTGMALKKHFGIPFVFEVRDLWPEALVNVGALSNSLVTAYLRWMALRFYNAADHITAASPGMKAGIMKYGIDGDKITVITNASDLELFHPEKDGMAERQRLGLDDRFAAIYFGAMGAANGLEYVLDAAAELKRRKRDDIVLVLHGDGGLRSKLQRRVARDVLDNVIFSDPVAEKTQMAAIVAGCDACLTIYKATRETTWSPNKFFDALAAGKPVLVNVPGWLGEAVMNNHCGFQTDPADSSTLCDALEKLADNPEMRKTCGENARYLAETEFAREIQGARLEQVFKHLLGQHPSMNSKTSSSN